MNRVESIDQTFLNAISNVVGDSSVSTDPADCWSYSYDNSRLQAQPQAVVYPRAHDEVLAVLQLCNNYEIPVVARGLGSSTTGSAVPLQGGIVLAFEKMNRILETDPANRVMRVEPGVTNTAVQQAAAEHGFCWGPEPTSSAYSTVGGNLACNAGGPRTVKYGTPRENTLGLRAITGSGTDIRTGVYTTKGVIGYDLTRLIIGSEGTLAVITEATLLLTPLAPAKCTLRMVYQDMQSAARAVSRIMAQPAIPSMLEFMDNASIEMIRDYAEVPLPEDAGAMLLIEVDGMQETLQYHVDKVSDAAHGEGMLDIRAASDETESQALWAARKALSPALRKIAPKKINEDIAVPVSRMAELISSLQDISAKFGIRIVNFGHAGNGNIHVNLLVDPDDASQANAAEPCLTAVFELVLSLGGTLSGEHGVGMQKQAYVGMEIEPQVMHLMLKIKQQFDPKNILNPGKLFPISADS